jgi:hypothetical protein
MVGHAARMEDMRNSYKALIGKPERRRHKGDAGIEVMMVLKLVLKKLDLMTWIAYIWGRVQWWALLNAIMNIRFP